MPTTWPLAATCPSFGTTATGVRYWPLGGDLEQAMAVIRASTTGEAPAQVMFRGSYTLDQLWVLVETNTRTDTMTVGTRKNSGAGTLTVSIATTLTGVFEDLVHSDTYVDGDLGNYTLIPGGGSGTLTLRASVVRCTSASSEQFLITGGGSEADGSLINHNMPLGGRIHTATPQSIAELRMDDAMTLRALRVVCLDNTATTNSPVRLRINSTDGNQTVTVIALTAGAYEDTTHSDSVVSGDLLYYALDITTSVIGKQITPTIFQMVAGATAGRMIAGWHDLQNPGTRGYAPPVGRWYRNTTETPSQMVARVAGVASSLEIFTYDNTLNAASPYTLRVNGAASALTVSVTTAATGRFRDTTHTVALVATDLVVTELDTTPSSSGQIFIANTLLMFDTTPVVADSFASAAQQMAGVNGSGFLGSRVRSY